MESLLTHAEILVLQQACINEGHKALAAFRSSLATANESTLRGILDMANWWASLAEKLNAMATDLETLETLEGEI